MLIRCDLSRRESYSVLITTIVLNLRVDNLFHDYGWLASARIDDPDLRRCVPCSSHATVHLLAVTTAVDERRDATVVGRRTAFEFHRSQGQSSSDGGQESGDSRRFDLFLIYNQITCLRSILAWTGPRLFMYVSTYVRRKQRLFPFIIDISVFSVPTLWILTGNSFLDANLVTEKSDGSPFVNLSALPSYRYCTD